MEKLAKKENAYDSAQSKAPKARKSAKLNALQKYSELAPTTNVDLADLGINTIKLDDYFEK